MACNSDRTYQTGRHVGEAASGAAGGGYTSNRMSKYLFDKSPKVGWVDTGINLLNAGLNLIPGMPEEVTTVTQTAADATPSSFATSVASNAGRGLWNTGKGIFTGDWEPVKQQGHDLTHGKGGAPLQGYATTVEAIVAGVSGDGEALDKIREENRSGERGKLPQWGSQLGAWSRDTATPWAANKLLDASEALMDTPVIGDMIFGSGTTELAKEQKRQEEEQRQRFKILDANREQVIKQYGEENFEKMWRGEVPISQEVHQMDDQRASAARQNMLNELEKVNGKEWVENMQKAGLF